MVELADDFKIYWDKSSIGRLIPGKDYLNPGLELIVDDILDYDQKQKLIIFLKNGLKTKINNILKSPCRY